MFCKLHKGHNTRTYLKNTNIEDEEEHEDEYDDPLNIQLCRLRVTRIGHCVQLLFQFIHPAGQLSVARIRFQAFDFFK